MSASPSYFALTDGTRQPTAARSDTSNNSNPIPTKPKRNRRTKRRQQQLKASQRSYEQAVSAAGFIIGESASGPTQPNGDLAQGAPLMAAVDGSIAPEATTTKKKRRPRHRRGPRVGNDEPVHEVSPSTKSNLSKPSPAAGPSTKGKKAKSKSSRKDKRQKARNVANARNKTKAKARKPLNPKKAKLKACLIIVQDRMNDTNTIADIVVNGILDMNIGSK